ncbi:hypothetical protein DGG96_09500 [Legionella qingyii]|uniref:Uncharacterized protein n=1 Tax=Legionella qingyii TaxID=2184757 RepID=A0A317U3L9_9GAMM|nr:hypothetical protein DGG96_09500 [Legionella qingyii]
MDAVDNDCGASNDLSILKINDVLGLVFEDFREELIAMLHLPSSINPNGAVLRVFLLRLRQQRAQLSNKPTNYLVKLAVSIFMQLRLQGEENVLLSKETIERISLVI